MNDFMTRIESFSAYGLNKFRNFLLPLQEIELNSSEEILNWAADALFDNECDNSAVFIHLMNNIGIIIIYSGLNKVDVIVSEEEIEPNTFFSSFDGDYRFCCYGILIEYQPGIFKTVVY